MISESEVKKILEKFVGSEKATALSADQNFYDAGFDSLDHASIFIGVEEKFGIKVPSQDVDKCCSIKTLIDYLNEKSQV